MQLTLVPVELLALGNWERAFLETEMELQEVVKEGLNSVRHTRGEKKEGEKKKKRNQRRTRAFPFFNLITGYEYTFIHKRSSQMRLESNPCHAWQKEGKSNPCESNLRKIFS